MRQRLCGDVRAPGAPASAAPQLIRDSLGSVPDLIEVNIAAAQLALGDARAIDLKAAADAAIDAGIVTPNIAALAMLQDDSLSDAVPLFRNVLNDLQITVPSTDEATWLLLRFHLRAIAEGSTDPEQGLEQVLAVYYLADRFHQSRQYAGDSHDIHPLIGLYWNLHDLSAHEADGNARRYNTAREELRTLVVEEAKSWVLKHAA